jgi:uncharacterized protein YhhL (DUF1145 family)
MLTFVHTSLGSAMMLFLLLSAVWCFGALVLGRPFPPGLVSTLILAEGLIVAQSLVGVLLLLAGARAGQWEHWMYGVTAALSLPAAYIYARRHSDRGRLFLFGVTALWIVALSVRGVQTGR